MTKQTRHLVMRVAAFLISIVPPIWAVCEYYPIWQAQDSTVAFGSGAFLVCLIVAVPLWRLIGKKIKTPAPFILWILAFLACFALNKVLDSLQAITFWGAISNSVAAIIYYIDKIINKEVINDG